MNMRSKTERLRDLPAHTTFSKPFHFATTTSIQAGQYLLMPKSLTKLSLNNDGDAARLIDPTGKIWESVCYEKAPEGKSFSYDEKNDEWFWTDPNAGGPAHTPTSTKPEVLGFSSLVVTHFSDITKTMDGNQIHLIGTVVVPPR